MAPTGETNEGKPFHTKGNLKDLYRMCGKSFLVPTNGKDLLLLKELIASGITREDVKNEDGHSFIEVKSVKSDPDGQVVNYLGGEVPDGCLVSKADDRLIIEIDINLLHLLPESNVMKAT